MIDDERFKITSILQQILALSLYDIEASISFNEKIEKPNPKIVRALEFLNDVLQDASKYRQVQTNNILKIEKDPQNKWCVLKSNFYEINNGEYCINSNIKYPLKQKTNVDFQRAIQLSDFTSLPIMFSLHDVTKDIWVYPYPNNNGFFSFIGKEFLPIISYNYNKEAGFVFNPVDLNILQNDIELRDYIVFSAAKKLCIMYNVPWPATKDSQLMQLSQKIQNKNFQYNVSSDDSIARGNNFERLEYDI